MKSRNNQYLLKLIIIGDCGVGKTNILMRYCENSFKLNYVSTIGVDFKIKTMQVGETKLKFQIWDTAGQQRYRNITQTYYKGAAGIILTYSVSDDKSFSNLQKWMKQINEHVPKDVIKILVCNKVDLDPEEWQVQSLEGKTLADKFGIQFMEVSAKTGQNIQQLFSKVGKDIVEIYLPNHTIEDPSMQLSRRLQAQSQKNKKNCQC